MTDAAVKELNLSPLDGVHRAANAKLVPFAGWSMPIQYQGIVAEHRAVRTCAGLFDVSHMGQLFVSGEAAVSEIQSRLSNDLSKITQVGSAQYSMLLNDNGGIEDDLIVYRIAKDELILVVNAANREHDVGLLGNLVEDVSAGWAMLALQGPMTLEVLSDVAGVDVKAQPSFSFVSAPIADAAVIIAITGYTGERGCELLVPADGAEALWELIAADSRVTLCGLGARDTLRLEACFPLHGSDLDAETNPIEAGLGFAAPAGISSSPPHLAIDRIRGESGSDQRRLTPILITGRGIPRSGMTVYDGDDVIGVTTSGTLSPTLRQGIALAWLKSTCADVGTNLQVDIRGKKVEAVVVKRPFVRGTH